MATTGKTFRDPFTNINVAGCGLGPQIQKREDVVVVTAEFSRKKPGDLTPTYMKIKRTTNNRRDDYVAEPACRIKGTALYAFPNYVQKTIRRNAPGTASPDFYLSQNKALAKFGSGSFDASVFLAELPKTAGFVLASLHRVNSMVKLLRKGQFQKAALALSDKPLSNRAVKRLNTLSPSKRVANGWLEYQYALKPLVSDVHGAVEALHAQTQEGAFVRSYTGPTREESKSFVPHRSDGFMTEPVLTNKVLPPIPPRSTVTGYVANPVLRTFQQLGLVNIAPAVWETIPFSFVVDWFVPIGDYLKIITAGAGMRSVWISTVVEERVDWYTKSGMVWTLTEQEVRREVRPVTGASIPQFPLSSVASLSGTRIITLAALIKQRSQ